MNGDIDAAALIESEHRPGCLLAPNWRDTLLHVVVYVGLVAAACWLHSRV